MRGKGSVCCGANQTRGPGRGGPRRGEDESPGTFRKKAGGVQLLTGGQLRNVQGGGGQQAAHWDCWMKEYRLQTPQSQDSEPTHLRGLKPVARLTGAVPGLPSVGLAEVVTGKYDQRRLWFSFHLRCRQEKTATTPLRLLYWRREMGSLTGVCGRAHFKSNS